MDDPSEPLSDDPPTPADPEYALPPKPDLPSVLPSFVPVERMHALLDRLESLPDDLARVEIIRDELRAVRTVANYLRSWRTFYCSRLWLSEARTHVIAKAAGVRDTFVSRRAREMGYPPRRVDKRRGP